MKITNKLLFMVLTIMLILPFTLAQDNNEIKAWGLDLEEILSLTNGLLALILFIITLIAYRIDGRKRFLFVSLAFLIYSLKSIIDSLEIFGISL